MISRSVMSTSTENTPTRLRLIRQKRKKWRWGNSRYSTLIFIRMFRHFKNHPLYTYMYWSIHEFLRCIWKQKVEFQCHNDDYRYMYIGVGGGKVYIKLDNVHEKNNWRHYFLECRWYYLVICQMKIMISPTCIWVHDTLITKLTAKKVTLLS